MAAKSVHDPAVSPEQSESRFLEHDSTLVVDDHVSLTLGSDSLVIVGMLFSAPCLSGVEH
jgi:hypothetical protein